MSPQQCRSPSGSWAHRDLMFQIILCCHCLHLNMTSHYFLALWLARLYCYRLLLWLLWQSESSVSGFVQGEEAGSEEEVRAAVELRRLDGDGGSWGERWGRHAVRSTQPPQVRGQQCWVIICLQKHFLLPLTRWPITLCQPIRAQLALVSFSFQTAGPSAINN